MGLGSGKRKLLAFLTAVVLALVAVYAVGPLKDHGTSASGPSVAPAKGAEETNGPGSFIGHASNAVVFIQWTRSGENVTGSLREVLTKQPAGSGLTNSGHAFTGVIHGSGLTLDIQGLEATAYVGETKGNAFNLSVPGTTNSLITIEFEPGNVEAFNEATKQLLLSEYSSPCSLYVTANDVLVSFTGTNAAEECASLVTKMPRTGWTTEPQSATAEQPVACELTNRSNEHAVVTDEGGQYLGREACQQLSGEGWG
jgi:hypothetical protein